MAVELVVPAVGESVLEVQIIRWLRAPGDHVRQDDPVVLIETDKASLELPAPVTGVLVATLRAAGETARVGEVIARFEPAPVEARVPAPGASPPEPGGPSPTADREAPVAGPAATPRAAPDRLEGRATVDAGGERPAAVPAGSPPAPPVAASPGPEPGGLGAAPRPEAAAGAASGDRREETVPMTLLRRRIAERLVQARQTQALLTTFNEIDLSAVQALRRAHQEAFQARHGVRLGIMSFFVRATVEALRRIPELNAEIRGTDMVYHRYYDIGIAVGTGRGLVVPVLRNADRLGFGAIEQAIADFARRAERHELRPEELLGGTFTITNGGIFGSLLSTPIVNPPQSGVLGLHAIQDRPVAREGQVVIRPMMYVALTYDHRIVDGREAVTFLRHVKALIEDPARLLLDL